MWKAAQILRAWSDAALHSAPSRLLWPDSLNTEFGRHGEGFHQSRRRSGTQPEEHLRRYSARQAGGHHWPERFGEVVAGLRHALRRGTAQVRRIALGLRAAVPRSIAEARCRFH